MVLTPLLMLATLVALARPTLRRRAGFSMGASAVLSVLATIWMVRTGDEGARLVWDGVIGVVRLTS